jgi:hypothetical protein
MNERGRRQDDPASFFPFASAHAVYSIETITTKRNSMRSVGIFTALDLAIRKARILCEE